MHSVSTTRSLTRSHREEAILDWKNFSKCPENTIEIIISKGLPRLVEGRVAKLDATERIVQLVDRHIKLAPGLARFGFAGNGKLGNVADPLDRCIDLVGVNSVPQTKDIRIGCLDDQPRVPLAILHDNAIHEDLLMRTQFQDQSSHLLDPFKARSAREGRA